MIDADSEYMLKTRHSIAGSRKNEGGIVDFALCVSNRPKVFVEAKKVAQGGFSEEEQTQLLRYCMLAGIQIGILTNGFDWHIYLKPKSLQPNDVANALAQKIAIDQGNVTEILETLTRLLGSKSISSGDVEKKLRKERNLFSRTLQKRKNLHHMNEAWDQLFAADASSLQKALTAPLKKVLKEKLGISDKKPLPFPVTKDGQIEAFVKNKCEELKDIVGQRATSYLSKEQDVSKEKTLQRPEPNQHSVAQGPAWFVWNGERREFRFWADALREFLDAVCDKIPQASGVLVKELPRKFKRGDQKVRRPHQLRNSDVQLSLDMNAEYIKNVGHRVCKILDLPADKFKFGN